MQTAWQGHSKASLPPMLFFDRKGLPLTPGKSNCATVTGEYSKAVMLTRDGVCVSIDPPAPTIVIVAEGLNAPFEAGQMRAVRVVLRHGHVVGIAMPLRADAERLALGILSMMRAAA